MGKGLKYWSDREVGDLIHTLQQILTLTINFILKLKTLKRDLSDPCHVG